MDGVEIARAATATPEPMAPCPLCGGVEGRPWLTKGELRYLLCACGFVVADVAPETFEAWNAEDFEADLERFAARSFEPKRQARYRKRLVSLQVACRSKRETPGAPRKLLEIGCNVGGFLSAVEGQGWEATGVEPVEACAEYARTHHGLDVRTGTLAEAALEPESFDAVYAHAVLEHLVDPLAVLREAFRVLRPGGCIFVDTVNASAFSARRLGTGWRLLDPRIHFCLWTHTTLRSALEQVGFRVSSLRSRGVRLRPNGAPALSPLAHAWEELRKLPRSVLAGVLLRGESISAMARKK